MGQEITRASNADRDRYANHIPELFTQGLITEEQMFHMLDMVLKAQTLVQLDDLLAGLPQPEMQPRPRDYAVPRNFLRVGLAATLFGLTLAVAVPTALSGHHGTVAATVAALCILWGVWTTVAAVVVMIVKGVAWGDMSEREKEERRRKDDQGR